MGCQSAVSPYTKLSSVQSEPASGEGRSPSPRGTSDRRRFDAAFRKFSRPPRFSLAAAALAQRTDAGRRVLVVHLVTNASVLNGPETFQKQVDTIHSLGVVLPLVEWTFIFIPLLFHALFGVLIIRSGHSNAGQYPLQRNIRYTLQRWTGMIAFVLHSLPRVAIALDGQAAGGRKVRSPLCHQQRRHNHSAPLVWVQAIYAIGVLACVYHLANGLWTMGITWGVWTSPRAQQRADYVCAVFGVVLAVVGLSALVRHVDRRPRRSPRDRARSP